MPYILLAILVLLQIADYWTARTALDRGDIEPGPVVAWAQRLYGFDTGLTVAKAAAAAVAIAVAVILPAAVWWWPWAVTALIVVYAVLIARNTGIVQTLAK